MGLALGMQMELNRIGAVYQSFNGDGTVPELEHWNGDEDRAGMGPCVGRVSRWGTAKGLCLELERRVADGDKCMSVGSGLAVGLLMQSGLRMTFGTGDPR